MNSGTIFTFILGKKRVLLSIVGNYRDQLIKRSVWVTARVTPDNIWMLFFPSNWDLSKSCGCFWNQVRDFRPNSSIEKQFWEPLLFISLIASGRYPENPAIWMVLGAGSIFLSPDRGHGNCGVFVLPPRPIRAWARLYLVWVLLRVSCAFSVRVRHVLV